MDRATGLYTHDAQRNLVVESTMIYYKMNILWGLLDHMDELQTSSLNADNARHTTDQACGVSCLRIVCPVGTDSEVLHRAHQQAGKRKRSRLSRSFPDHEIIFGTAADKSQLCEPVARSGDGRAGRHGGAPTRLSAGCMVNAQGSRGRNPFHTPRGVYDRTSSHPLVQ
jgi:hypothetical protein